MLEQLSKLGFLFDVESLVSRHGNEAVMLEDMAGAVNDLRNVRFVLVDEQEEIGETDEEGFGGKSPRSVSYRLNEEAKHCPSSSDPSEESVSSLGAASSDGDEKGMELKVKQRQSMHLESLESAASSNSTNSTNSINSTGIGGVIDVDVFTSIGDALSETSSANAGDLESPDGPSSSRGDPNANWDNVQSLVPASVDKLFSYTNLVIRVKVRSGKVKLTRALRHGGPIKVCPVLFTQGINEKQTLANNTGSSVTRLQDVTNANSLKTLRNYCDRYCNFTSMRQMQAPQKQERRRDVQVLTVFDAKNVFTDTAMAKNSYTRDAAERVIRNDTVDLLGFVRLFISSLELPGCFPNDTPMNMALGYNYYWDVVIEANVPLE
ncbi:hypothetical protein PR001_g17184 [Phytophthora rubi]|uniref:Uncharacterized protein n=1 Tax=Phytophthora rubi TaxID=129364 RepID=A0A6A3KSU0_9STRA|nr:hypothetical protein PR001_g17184 [Phytophthora rubi]KAE9017126.1 hypothetical protein PR002_g13474 [Phytophthora rubi]